MLVCVSSFAFLLKLRSVNCSYFSKIKHFKQLANLLLFDYEVNLIFKIREKFSIFISVLLCTELLFIAYRILLFDVKSFVTILFLRYYVGDATVS